MMTMVLMARSSIIFQYCSIMSERGCSATIYSLVLPSTCALGTHHHRDTPVESSPYPNKAGIDVVISTALWITKYYSITVHCKKRRKEQEE